MIGPCKDTMAFLTALPFQRRLDLFEGMGLLDAEEQSPEEDLKRLLVSIRLKRKLRRRSLN